MASNLSPPWPAPRPTGEAPEIGVGMLGYAFMGKAHTNAYKKIPYMMYPPPAIPRLVAICGRNEEAVAEAAQRYGYERYYTDWRKMLEDDRDPALRQRRPQRRARRAVHRGRAGGQARLLREAAGPHRRRGEGDAGCGGEGRRQAHGGLQLPLRAGRPPGVRADPERRAGPDLPLPRRLPARMDHAALRHADDLAPGQEAARAAARWATWARTSSTWAASWCGEIKSVSAR